jgi:hypothetical protein
MCGPPPIDDRNQAEDDHVVAGSSKKQRRLWKHRMATCLENEEQYAFFDRIRRSKLVLSPEGKKNQKLQIKSDPFMSLAIFVFSKEWDWIVIGRGKPSTWVRMSW